MTKIIFIFLVLFDTLYGELHVWGPNLEVFWGPFKHSRFAWSRDWKVCRNECRNSMLIMCHYPDLKGPSDWLEICFNQSEARGVTIHIPFDSIWFWLWSFSGFWIFWLDYPSCCTITHKEAVMLQHKWLKTSRGYQPHGFVRPCLRKWHWQGADTWKHSRGGRKAKF